MYRPPTVYATLTGECVPLLHALLPDRHYAEFAGYWETTSFLKEESAESGEIPFYDSNSGKLLFTAPKNRDWEDFVKESKSHGW